MRLPIKTKKKDIADFWFYRVNESDLGCDYTEALNRCWRCGKETSLEKCHIIPHSLGGGDCVDNLVLLCGGCHKEMPNINDKGIFWNWIKKTSSTFYDSFGVFSAIKEYKTFYGVDFISEMVKNGGNKSNLKKFLGENKKSFSYHFGQGGINQATTIGMFHKYIKELEEKGHDV